MDMDNARWAMDVLRAAAEQNEDRLRLDSNTPNVANPYQLPVPPEYVSQFRIDGQPILPPLMTAEKRRQMQQLRQQAMALEAKYRQPHAIRSTSTLDEEQADSSSSSNTSKSSNNSSITNSTINSMQRLPQLQQTETFIYDSTRQQQQQQQLQQKDVHQEEELSSSAGHNRPQTLNIEPKKHAALAGVTIPAIPTICVNPPTPLQPSTKPPCMSTPTMATSSTTSSIALSAMRQRKLNNISGRIRQFERTGLGRRMELLQPESTHLLWQNETLIGPADKRMMRSSTSPALSASQVDVQQLHRSRSFTLEQPSQALIEHMQREGKRPPTPPAVPPPVPPLPAQLSTRCRFALPATCNGNGSGCSSTLGLEHLRRDTVESRAKQVQRNTSRSPVTPSKGGRRRGGSSNSTTARLQHQQQQLEDLLQRALHETTDCLAGQEQVERNRLALAKRQMFKDIKTAHRDRFQQLVQYQHEEQRRMQEEFDRQQKFLIEQICTEINVSAYAHEPLTDAASPSAISEYTSTDDLPTPTATYQSSANNTIALDSLEITPLSSEFLSQEQSKHMVRKRLFDMDNDSEGQGIELMSLPLPLPLQSASSSPKSRSLRSNNSKIKKPVQRSQSKKVSSPLLLSKSPTPVQRASKTISKNGNNNNNNSSSINNKTTTLTSQTKPTSKNNTRSSPQQQQSLQLAKTRRSVSPSRLTSEMQRRHEAATLLNAATRGFLVRRLFRTEQVQRIVQTIRDTLIFVLNLHLETYGSSLEQEEPANIRLKARLLQQLCSASRTLHLIFFQTSIKERMEIIARDRKRIKIKLLATHIKQRS
ncbi:uncharacterized protein LOC6565038 isoform X2 [Drosophila grimshawi]|uniref:GH12437 n=1 Tax=Drosophila grimshawi TaxID=7222 RepID=B4JJ60_DROGR|nr:uncharacterized protein LOC6565038 isoform X2 [Drosophila grimshawi]EDV99612.1 GH12437 [Drosophila grimshawi]